MGKEEKKQMKKRFILLDKEAKSFHEIITSYEGEVTLQNITMKKLKTMDELYKSNKDRNNELESVVEELRKQKDRITLEFVKIMAFMDKHNIQYVNEGSEEIINFITHEKLQEFEQELAFTKSQIENFQEI